MKEFELTVTVNPRRKNIGGTGYDTSYGKMGIMEQWNILRDSISRLFKAGEIYIRPELHKNLNVHLHGHVYFPANTPKIDIEIIRKELEIGYGRCSFTLLSNPDKWIDYMEKEKEGMRDLHYKSAWYQACRHGMV